MTNHHDNDANRWGSRRVHVSSPRYVFFFSFHFILYTNVFLPAPDPTTTKPDPEGQQRSACAHARPTTANAGQCRPTSRVVAAPAEGLETTAAEGLETLSSRAQDMFFFSILFCHTNDILPPPDPTTTKPGPEGNEGQHAPMTGLQNKGQHRPTTANKSQHRRQRKPTSLYSHISTLEVWLNIYIIN